MPIPSSKLKRNGPVLADTKYLPYLIGVLIFFIAVGMYGIRSVEKEIKNNLSNQLQLTLEANIASLKLFFEDKKLVAKVLAEQPEIRQKILSLIQLNKEKDVPAKKLQETDSLKWLREHLGKVAKNYGFIGFVVFDSTGFQVGALLEEPLGRRQLIESSVFFYRSMQGDTVVSNPFAGEVNLPDEGGRFLPGQTTQFVSTPIKDRDGNILGVLAFRLRPQKEFGRILAVSRFGNTGETYAFNDEGLLISNSRFDPQLKKMGLISEHQSSIFNIQIRDPGRDLRKKPKMLGELTETWPLTKMAKSALLKNNSGSLESYNDYRGVPVVGVWTWIEDQQLGIATEIDSEEALAPLNALLFWYLILFGLLVFSVLIGLFLRLRILKTRRQTQENQDRLISLTGIISDSVVAINKEGTIQTVNPAVEKVFGYTPKELIGENVKILMPEPYFSEHDSYLENYLRTGEKKIINMVTEVTGLKKNGSTFPLELSVSESTTNNEKVFVGVLRDISERKASEVELQLAYKELENRIKERTHELKVAKELAENHNHAKSEFLSRMSHELRTPMNAILGFAQIMDESQKDPLPDSHKSRIHQILKAGSHLLELINEVLDLARIEAGKITVSLEPVNIAELSSDVLNVIRPLAEKYQIELIDQISMHDGIFIQADKTRLKQVLLNLLSNSIKYNRKEGSVTISMEKQNTGNIKIEVADTGMGIPPGKLNKIFEPFDRLGSENSEIEGTGIGMAISKKLIELMKGNIEVNSTLGKGSKFSVSFPHCHSVAFNNGRNSTHLGNHSFETQKNEFTILYIEDNKANMLLVQDILSDFNDIKLLTAPQAILGLDLAHSHKPDLIILDINLPDIDGFETLKRLQNMEETHYIPVIALSANAMQKDIDRALDRGFRNYLTKPIDILKFKKTIENFYLNSTTSI